MIKFWRKIRIFYHKSCFFECIKSLQCYELTRRCNHFPLCTNLWSIPMVRDRILFWPQFILQWFIRFPEFTEFLFHLGKAPMCTNAEIAMDFKLHFYYLYIYIVHKKFLLLRPTRAKDGATELIHDLRSSVNKIFFPVLWTKMIFITSNHRKTGVNIVVLVNWF